MPDTLIINTKFIDLPQCTQLSDEHLNVQEIQQKIIHHQINDLPNFLGRIEHPHFEAAVNQILANCWDEAIVKTKFNKHHFTRKQLIQVLEQYHQIILKNFVEYNESALKRRAQKRTN